ncbi:MAG: mechanosensitive ion channel family protein, partial [Cyanobium sp.]
ALALLLVVLGPWRGLQAAPPPAALAGPAAEGTAALPIESQPFYPQLLRTAARWGDAPLGEVVGDSPRDTLLNFYAVMARVHATIQEVRAEAWRDPGWFWSPAARRRIRAAEELFGQAVQALDAGAFAESVQGDMAEEAAMQLKEVLDYVFSHSESPITIPDSAELKQLNRERSEPSQSWSLPQTAINLSSLSTEPDRNGGFRFSEGTVAQIGRLYGEIQGLPPVRQPFASPGFYADYVSTPGYLVPPKWYMRLPAELRRLLELSVDGQTLLQIAAALAVLLLYAALIRWMVLQLLHTYRYWNGEAGSAAEGGEPRRPWHQDNVAWARVLLTLPALPLTRLGELVIDDLVNFTGTPLVLVTYAFFVAYFLAASACAFFLFEALGRSLSEWLVKLRGGSELQLRRVSNLVMPVCRVLGALVAVVLIYRLLIVLGLPPSTVLAFSAVPGLAIGLGASKLLGNLFAGLSIQTDRPVRVGEFCRIGDNLGFVTRIGLRSLELETLDSRVTIPNAIADDETIINYSRRQPGAAGPSQSLMVELEVSHPFSPEQVSDLLQFARRAVAAIPELREPLVSLRQEGVQGITLLCHGLLDGQDWPQVLVAREALLLRLQEVVEQVRLSTRQIGVSYDTSTDQLQRLPELIREVVERDPAMALQSCRLMAISEFSYDIVFRLHGHHDGFGRFKDGIDRLNRALLERFAAEGIEIPYPTAVEIQREA